MADRPGLLEMLGQTWPARMAKSAWEAAKLPGDVYAGRVDPLSDEGIGRSADLAGMVMGGTYAGAPAGAVGAGAVKPIRAYHGSPHDFDRFDLSKIGTGEGAQVYGHGLYFAEKEAVAKEYRDALSRGGVQKFVGDVPYNRDDPMHLASNLLNTYKGKGDPRAVAIAELRADINNPALIPERRAIYAQTADILESGAPLGSYRKTEPGRMYEVNINAAPEQFLDWDKALAQQAPEVRERLHKGWLAHSDDHAHQTGEQIYRANTPGFVSSGAYREPQHARASEVLREAGIPGIKYLDQGSRGNWTVRENPKGFYGVQSTSPGYGGAMSEYFPTREAAQDWIKKQETSNYVLFRDDIIDIVKKYGLAGAAAIYGISQDEAKAAMEKPKTTIGRQNYGDEE